MILAISGSLRRDSLNSAALRAIARASSRSGVEVVIDAAPAILPPFNPDLEAEPPEAVLRFRRACEEAEAVLLAVPEYAFGIPGAFKNALDWTVGGGSLYRKPIALLSVAPRGRGAHVRHALDDVFTALDGEVTHYAVPLAPAARGADGEIREPHIVEALQAVVAELHERARSRSAETQVPLRASREPEASITQEEERAMATAVQALDGTYELDKAHSTIQFSVRHLGVSTFRASFADIEARLTIDDGPGELDARALVESISIVEPPEFREHVVRGTDFFAADDHPQIAFRSQNLVFEEDGTAVVSGELTIRGVSREVTAKGTFIPPTGDPFGGRRIGLALDATIDRKEWGMDWQAPLPDGGDALGWEVAVSAHLELTRVP